MNCALHEATCMLHRCARQQCRSEWEQQHLSLSLSVHNRSLLRQRTHVCSSYCLVLLSDVSHWISLVVNSYSTFGWISHNTNPSARFLQLDAIHVAQPTVSTKWKDNNYTTIFRVCSLSLFSELPKLDPIPKQNAWMPFISPNQSNHHKIATRYFLKYENTQKWAMMTT